MKIVVGLGNPGSQYHATRHNVGFDVVDALAGDASYRSRFQAQVADRFEESEKLVLAKPETYMNRSGQTVRSLMDFYQLAVEDLLVVCDDFNLPLGKLRFRSKGSTGGHKGLQSIQEHLGTNEYGRLRIGVGAPGENDTVDFVLGRFRPGERPVIKDAIITAAQAAVIWIHQGISVCMNQYNG